MLKYYNHCVRYNDKIKNGVGIITGWKNPPEIESILTEDTKKYVKTIGTLYTKNGINFIIANLFFNPEINHLVLLEDSDLNNQISDSIKCLINLLQTRKMEFASQFHFTEEQIEEFCDYFKKHFSVVPIGKLNEAIREIDCSNPWRKDEVEIEPKSAQVNQSLASEKIGFLVRANDVKTAWLRSLKLIGNYGNLKQSDYDEDQLELMNLQTIIRSEDLNNPSMVGSLGITKEELDNYAKKLLDKKKPNNIRYSYGNRFRDYEGIDQLEYLSKILKDKSYSRRAVATLWNPTLDTIYDEVPCIDLYQAVVEDERLYLMAYFRANDVLNAYPRNVYGILRVQEELCKRLNLQKGYINTIAGSAHIYSRDFNELENYANKNISFCEEDERGYFYIEVKDGFIEVSFYSKEGVLLRRFQGKNATELRRKCCFLISNIDHAFYLGQELTKAEIALSNQMPYIQDRKLSLTKEDFKNSN